MTFLSIFTFCTNSIRRPVIGVLLVMFCVAAGRVVSGQEVDPFHKLLERGQQHFEDGEYNNAETVLLEAVDVNSKSYEAHYWLGRTYYELQDNRKSENHYRQSIRRNKKFSDAYIGLGRTYMRIKNRMIDARQTMKEGLKYDPTNADVYYQLGMSYLEQSRRDPAAPLYVNQGRQAFQQAVAYDTQHPDAYYQLALSYEFPSRDYNRAMSIFYKQLSVNPGHRDALSHLGKCSFLTKQYRVGVDLLEQLMDTHGDALPTYSKTLLAQLKASLLQEEREYDKAAEMYDEFIEGLDPAERIYYSDLKYVANDREMTVYEQASESEKQGIVQKFWGSRDPDPATVVNERLVEHYRRVLHAREYYSLGQKPWDRRGDIYIRYGEPDDLQHFLLRAGEKALLNYQPTGDARIDAIRERNYLLRYRLKVDNAGLPWANMTNRTIIDPDSDDKNIVPMTTQDIHSFSFRAGQETQGLVFVSESWVYVEHDLELFFVDQLGMGKFDYPLGIHETSIEEASIQSRFHPQRAAEQLINRNPETYRFDYGGQPLELLYDMVTYKGNNEQTLVEFAYSVPTRQLGTVEDGQGLKTWFDSHVVLRDQDYHRIANTSSKLGPMDRPLGRKSDKEIGVDLRTASIALHAPPGEYNSAIEVRDEASRRIGIFQQSLTVPDYTGKRLGLSDIRLANSIIQHDEPGPFVRHGLKIEPNPSRIFQDTDPVHFYFEIYNLTPDVTGLTSYRTELEVTTKERKGNIVWRFLSSLGNLINRSDNTESVMMLFEDEGEMANEYKYTSIDTGDSPTATYVMTLTITDLVSDQTVTKTREFVVTNDRRRWFEEETLKMIDMRVIPDQEGHDGP